MMLLYNEMLNIVKTIQDYQKPRHLRAVCTTNYKPPDKLHVGQLLNTGTTGRKKG